MEQLCGGNDAPNVELGPGAPGLMLKQMSMMNPDDFKGSVVKKGSFVMSSKHVIKTADANRIATMEDKGSSTWMEVRRSFLSKKETRLRARHRALADKLRMVCFASKTRLEVLDWVILLTGGAADQNRNFATQLTLGVDGIKVKMARLVQPLVLKRIPVRGARRHCTIEPPPLEGEGVEAIESWAKDLNAGVEACFAEVFQWLQCLDEVLSFLDGVENGTQEANISMHPDEHDWTTYMVRRAAIACLEDLEERADSLPEVLDNLEQNSGIEGEPAQFCLTTHLSTVQTKCLMPEAWQLVAASCLFRSNIDDSHVLADLVNSLQPMIFAQDAPLIKQGTLASDMYFLGGGSCKVMLGEDHIASRRNGDVIGEIAMVHSTERTADVVAEDITEAYQLTRKDFRQVAQKHPFLLE